MFERVLIANRGAIAVRVARTLRAMGIYSVGVYAESDRDSLHLSAVDKAISLGEGRAADTYLNQDKLLAIMASEGIEAVHPGYGFLSENASFAERLERAGITFIGPKPEHLRQFGLKHEARDAAQSAGVNLLPGSELLHSLEDALSHATAIGYPVMLKSTAGGGGIGMQRCTSHDDLNRAYEAVRELAGNNFGDSGVFLERLVVNPRHVEVQAFGDGTGNVVTLGDRDCSLQRRHQKVIEECPAPGIPDEIRNAMQSQAGRLLASVGYANAATVEFLYDAAETSFYFLEVNTRLQVEHGVTEEVYGVDLVEWMVRQAAGEPIGKPNEPRGHAVQARVYAENPLFDFRPAPGRITDVTWPQSDVRVDAWVQPGGEVSPFFDPMLGKVIAHADDRESAIRRLDQALSESRCYGIETNLEYLRRALALPSFVTGTMSTASLADIDYTPTSIDVLTSGPYTTIQSYPGRQGYWSVGVPPSGPMDDLSFRLANQLLGNSPDCAGLEMVISGPTVQFNTDTSIAIVGDCECTLDGTACSTGRTLDIRAGQTLAIGRITSGCRAYLCFLGGLDLPVALGSTATFTLGNMGGLHGRTLRTGDTLHLNESGHATPAECDPPDYESRHTLRVLLGPHTSPDFFTDDFMQSLVDTTWTVHYNSSRTGVRLTGPQPGWSREDGGEAGLHPSNIHDNAYAFGSIDFTGDMPVILGPDGPSLGGFVCPGVVINADRWKTGQLVAGDHVQFKVVNEDEAHELLANQQQYVASLRHQDVSENTETTKQYSPVIHGPESPSQKEDIVIRMSGQEWVLVEFGLPELDIEQHLRMHGLKRQIETSALPGIVEMTPGIRSLQIRFDVHRWRFDSLKAELIKLLAEEGESREPVASRIVHLPLSWDDPACREAIDIYTQSVRDNAPWCPDNIEFIRRINGLERREDVKQIVFDASYLVMGLGDVYLGAPVATPLDPRHRLVTTKYNPARTWTAENSVGIGGSYLCIYGMEGPGGYQFVGRTLQVWNQHKRGDAFSEYWLLRPFDQLRFYEVGAQELLDMRDAFARGDMSINIEDTTFDPSAYQQFLTDNATAIARFKDQRTAAFARELDDWKQKDLLTFETQVDAPVSTETELPEGAIASPMSGSVWSVRVEPGADVKQDDVLIVLEAMKSEFEIRAPATGTVELLVKEGQLVTSGQALAVIS